MKITKLETVRVAERANLLWVLVHTDEVITGLGETFYGAETVETYVHEYIAPRVIGRDPLQIDLLAQDLVGYLSADREFHMLLLGAGHNDALVVLVGKLRDLTRLFGLQHLASTGELTPSADEHLEMVALLRAGEAKQLGALMRRHIRHTREKWAKS